jgi:hypothetical protein
VETKPEENDDEDSYNIDENEESDELEHDGDNTSEHSSIDLKEYL